MPLYNFLVWQWCVRSCKSDHLHSHKPYYALWCFPDIHSTDIKLSLNRYNLLEEYWTPNLHLPHDTCLRIPIKDWDEYSEKPTHIRQPLLLMNCLTYPLSYTTTFSSVMKRPKENVKNMTNIVFSKNSQCPAVPGQGECRDCLLWLWGKEGISRSCVYMYQGNSEVFVNSVCWWQEEGYHNLSVSRICDQHLKLEKVLSTAAMWQWSGWK